MFEDGVAAQLRGRFRARPRARWPRTSVRQIRRCSPGRSPCRGRHGRDRRVARRSTFPGCRSRSARAVDELGVEAKSDDDQIFRRPADSTARSSRFLRIFSVMCSPPGSWSPHSNSTQRRPAASCLEPPHHRGAAIQIAPALEVSDRNVKFVAHGARTDCAGRASRPRPRHRHQVIPETDRRVLLCAWYREDDRPSSRLPRARRWRRYLEADGRARGVLGADIERQSRPTCGRR